MNIIFLDIDGVINNPGIEVSDHYYYIKTGLHRPMVDSYMLYLLSIIITKTNSKVVLTSIRRGAWNSPNMIPTRGSAILIDKELKRFNINVYSLTPTLRNVKREEEIIKWLNNNPNIDNYVILDDSLIDYEKLLNHLVYIEPTDIYGGGLKPKHIDESIKILTKKK